VLTRLLFRAEDDVLLTHIMDDGDKVEPVFFVPILPTILINGCTAGIGTGWSSQVPCYNPVFITAYESKRKSVVIIASGAIGHFIFDKNKRRLFFFFSFFFFFAFSSFFSFLKKTDESILIFSSGGSQSISEEPPQTFCLLLFHTTILEPIRKSRG